MAVLGSITINEISIAEVNASPVIDQVSLPIGSLAIDTVTGILYTKTGPLNSDWSPAASGGSQPGGDFVFEGSVTVRADSSFQVGVLSASVRSIRDVYLEIIGSTTVSTGGRILVGPNSSASVRSA